eukprot:scaffold9334_cov122-Isochrysis_galbana.AAC.2
MSNAEGRRTRTPRQPTRNNPTPYVPFPSGLPNPPPLQAGSCQVCRSMKGEGDRGLGEIGESEC